jgi:hypothetical protein
MQQIPSGIDPNLLAELRAGEQILWWGYPNPKRRMRRRQFNMLTVRFAIILAVFLFMVYEDFTLVPDWSFLETSTVLILIVANIVILFSLVYILLIYRTNLRVLGQFRYTVYAITNQRAIMITAFPGKVRAVASYSKDEIGTISRQEGQDGWGDLTFGILRPVNVGTRTVLAPSRFSGIPNVRRVEEIMFRTFKNPIEQSPPAPGERVSYEQ